MKTNMAGRVRTALSALVLLGAALSLIGCADEYVAYPGYGRGYYASYPGYRPYYGAYGYGPYRHYGPYYSSPYYPYYGSGAAVVVSGSRSYGYRDGYGRSFRRDGKFRSRKEKRRVINRSQQVLSRDDQDNERRYYQPR